MDFNNLNALEQEEAIEFRFALGDFASIVERTFFDLSLQVRFLTHVSCGVVG